MKKFRKLAARIISGICSTALFLISAPFFANTADAAVYNGSDIVTNNIHDHVYQSQSCVSNSYLIDNGNGTFSRLENMGDILLVETYNAAFQLQRKSTIGMELTKFGGAYSTANYNYIVFGQDNPGKNSGLETMRIVRYSKSWSRLSAAAVVNTNSLRMFEGGNLDFASYGDMIYIRCSHINYDGRQANLTVSYRISTSKVTDIQGTSDAGKGGYEGTAAQYIDAVGGSLTAVDARLSSVYGVCFSKYQAAAGGDSFRSAVTNANCLGNAGAINGAATYFTVGGYESSSQYHLAVGTTTPLDGSASNRNVYVAAVPRGNFAGSQISISYMTGYAAGSTLFCETPFLVKVSADRFMVLWETRNGASDQEKVSYVMVDGKGNKTTDINTISGCLSDCQPICFGGQVVWYTTNGAAMKIYTIPVPGASAAPSAGQPAYVGTAVYKGVDYSLVYDFNYYCNRYPDIRVLFGNKPEAALAHFVNNGMKEGRQACDNFNVQIYKQNYEDLRNAFGDNLKAYYLHFINNGSRENRNARTYR